MPLPGDRTLGQTAELLAANTQYRPSSQEISDISIVRGTGAWRWQKVIPCSNRELRRGSSTNASSLAKLAENDRSEKINNWQDNGNNSIQLVGWEAWYPTSKYSNFEENC